MYLNLVAKLAVLLVLLTSTGLTDASCFTYGNTWDDVGDDDTIELAFQRICLSMAGNHRVRDTAQACVNVEDNRIDASITILETENSTSGSLDAYLNRQVKTDCNIKGGLMNEVAWLLGPESQKYGSIRGDVKVDPNNGGC